MSTKPNVDQLSVVRDVAFICSIFLYFLGYQYEQTLFRLIGIPSLTDISPLSFIAYSFSAFEHGPLTPTVLGSAVAILLGTIYNIITRRIAISPANRSRFGFAASAFITVLAFPSLHYYAVAAAYDAERDLKNGSGIPAAIVGGEIPQPLRKYNALCQKEISASILRQCSLWLVSEDNDNAYFTYGKGGALGLTFDIRKDKGIVIMRLSR